MGYYVNIQEPGELTAHGPYALPRAKDFARIGSQTGGDRIVTRGFRGPVVRIYSEGKRLWPMDLSQGEGLKRAELPRSLVAEVEHMTAMAANPGSWPEGWAAAQRARGRGWAPTPRSRKDQLVNQIINDSFCLAYVDAALWDSDYDRDDTGGVPLNRNYGINHFTDEGLERIIANCEAFQEMPGVDDAIGSDYAEAGSDFWHTTSEAGVGFWDGSWSPEDEEVLMAAAKQFDGFSVYVGDDGYLYFGER